MREYCRNSNPDALSATDRSITPESHRASKRNTIRPPERMRCDVASLHASQRHQEHHIREGLPAVRPGNTKPFPFESDDWHTTRVRQAQRRQRSERGRPHEKLPAGGETKPVCAQQFVRRNEAAGLQSRGRAEEAVHGGVDRLRTTTVRSIHRFGPEFWTIRARMPSHKAEPPRDDVLLLSRRDDAAMVVRPVDGPNKCQALLRLNRDALVEEFGAAGV